MALSTGMINGVEYVFTTSGEGKVTAVLKSQYDAMEKTAASAEKVGKTTKSAFSGMAKSIMAAAAAYVSFRTAANAVKYVVNASLEAESAIVGINAALKNTAIYSEQFSQAIRDNADALMQLTIYDDEAILAGTALAQNIGKMSQEDLPKAQKAAIGLAAAYGVDLKTAFQLVGKASAGNTSMLGRMGIVLNATGGSQEKFNELLAIGAEKFAIAEANANTTTGRIAQLKNAMGELAEEIGNTVKPVLDGMFSGIQDAIANTLKNMKEIPAEAESDAARTAAVVERFTANFLTVMGGILTAAQDIVIGVGSFIVAALENTWNMIKTIKQALHDLYNAALNLPKDLANFLAYGDASGLGDSWGAIADTFGKFGADTNDVWLGRVKPVFDMIAGDFEQFNDNLLANDARVNARLKAKLEEIAGRVGNGTGGGGGGGAGTAGLDLMADAWANIAKETQLSLDKANKYYSDVAIVESENAMKRTQSMAAELPSWEKRLALANAILANYQALGLTEQEYTNILSITIGERIKALEAEGLSYEQLAAIRAEAMKTGLADYAANQQAAMIEQHRAAYEFINGTVSVLANGFTRMIREGRNFADSIKRMFKDLADFAIQEIMRIIAKMTVLFLLKSIFGIASAGVGAGALGAGAGDLAGTGAGLAGYTPSTPQALPSIGGDNGTRGVMQELRAMRMALVESQNKTVKIDWRRGDMSYALDRDRKYRVGLAT